MQNLSSHEKYSLHVHTPTEKLVGGKFIDKQLKIKVKAPWIIILLPAFTVGIFSNKNAVLFFPCKTFRTTEMFSYLQT